MSRYYPPLEKGAVSSIKTIQRLLIEDPSFLEDAPYDEDTKAWLKSLMPVSSFIEDADSIEDLEAEATSVYLFLRRLKPETATAGDKAGLDYVKASASLLDKLLTLVERAKKVKEIENFQNTVISFLEDILLPEQRTLFMDRINEVR